MKLLVTGTSGFIGTSFCERFARSRKYEILGVDKRPPTERFDSVDYACMDLTDRNAVTGLIRRAEPEVIVHLAAQARVDPSLQRASPTYRDNVVATAHLIEAAEELRGRIPTFVYASSETVYGDARHYPTDEDTETRPQSPYAASKAACELLVTRAFRERSVVIRSGMGYGPRSDPRAQVVARFISRALTGRPILFPRVAPAKGHPTRDINHVSNFLDGLELAISAGAMGTFNIASGVETSVRELAEFVVTAVGAGEIQLTDEFQYRPGEAGARTWLDVTRAKDAFGYVPRISLSEGLTSTAAWYRGHMRLFETSSSVGSPDSG